MDIKYYHHDDIVIRNNIFPGKQKDIHFNTIYKAFKYIVDLFENIYKNDDYINYVLNNINYVPYIPIIDIRKYNYFLRKNNLLLK